MAATNFRDVFIAEDKILRERRAEAGLDQTPLPASQNAGGDNDSAEAGPFPRAGLAISGGGIRSASFGLGFLQAMYRHGVLRQMDYLSTVSGGSFVGCYLSTSIADREQGSITLDPSATPPLPSPPANNGQAVEAVDGNPDSAAGAKSENNHSPAAGSRHHLQSVLPLLPKKCGANTVDLNRLSQAGNALNRPLAFFNRLLLGMLLINLTAFSGIIALAALFAVAYRSLYDLGFQHFLNEAGFVGDLQKPWFPAAVLLPIWLFTSWMSRERTIRDFKMEARWQHINRGMFLLLVASIFMAMASLLTVADPSVPLLAQGKEITTVTEKTSDWMSWLSHIAVGAVFAALIPYLSPTALIRSGTDPKSPPKYKWIFNIASRALLYGMPLVIFGLICRENISGYQEKRADRYEMAPMSVTEWHSFWRRVDREASGDRETGAARNPRTLWFFKLRDSVKDLLGFKADPPAPQGISQRLWETMTKGEDPPNPNPKAPTIGKSILLSEKLDKRTREHSILKLWNPAVLASMWNPFTFKSRVEERGRNLRWREQYIQQLNAKCLSDPGLHRYFDLDKDSQGKKRDANFVGLHEHALDLESTAREILKTPPFQAMLLGGASEAEALAGEIERLRLLANNPDEHEDHVLDAERKLNQLVGLQAEIRKTNWGLLKSHYGEDLRSYDTIFSYVVLAEDQKFRLLLAAGFGLIFLTLGVFLPLNGVSVHSYYRQQLGSVWLNPVGNSGGEAALAAVDTVSHGFPYHLINATLHQMGSKYDTELFIFSPRYCGSYRTGFVETSKFDGGMNITDAMAVSGAAITPFAAPNPLVRMLLLLANFRLGRWLPNPARKSASHFPPAPLPLLWSMFRDPDHGTHCFVTDGGLADNTGIASLLHRRCRVIIAVDASQDEDSHFHDLLRLLSTQRTEFGRDLSGVTFTSSDGTQMAAAETAFERDRIPLELLQCQANGNARSHYVVARIHYPEDRYAADAGLAGSLTGYLIYVKPSFDGDEPTDLVQYRDDNSDFPHDPTYDQFFNSHKFQSYQRLGKHIGEEVWEHLLKASAKAARTQDQKDKRELLSPWLPLWEPNGPEPQAADPLDRLRETALGSAPFRETFRHFQEALEHQDVEFRRRVYAVMGDYLESHSVDHPAGPLRREERRQLCQMLIERYRKEDQEDIKKTITGQLQQCGEQLKEVKAFFNGGTHGRPAAGAGMD